MFEGMGLGRLPTDTLEQQLVANRELKSRVEAEQLDILEELDSRQVAVGDGYRSLSDWVAARLDVSFDTARALVRTMHRLVDRPDLRDALSSGVSFDRVEGPVSYPPTCGSSRAHGCGRRAPGAGETCGVSADAEQRTVADRFLVMQPSLDESWWRLWGGLDGYAGAIIDKVHTTPQGRIRLHKPTQIRGPLDRRPRRPLHAHR